MKPESLFSMKIFFSCRFAGKRAFLINCIGARNDVRIIAKLKQKLLERNTTMNKMTVAILALALTGSVAFAQGQGNGGGRGGNRGGNRGGARGGAAAGQVQPGGAGGAGAAGMQGGGQGGFGGGQGGFGGAAGGAGGRGGRGGRGGGQGGFGGGQGGFGGGQGGFGGGQGGFGGGQGGFGGGQGGFGGGQGGFGGGQGGFGGAGMGAGMGGFGGGQGGFGGAGMGAGMGGARNGQLQRTIERLKADTPRDEALKKIEAKDKDAYAKVKKAIDDANAQLAELAKKAEVELPDTAEQQKAKALEFLAKEKDAIDKLLETDKTDSASAMQSFNELAQKNKITITPNGGRGALNGQQAGGRSTARGGVNTNAIRQIQEKFPEEYAEAQKLREDNPTAYREKMRELQNKLNSAN
jgi:dsDNA-binding SOS-regulon protein